MKFFSFVSLAGFVTLASGKFSRHHELGDHYSFADYLKESGKSYSASEYKHRQEIFEKNLLKIRQHNSDKTKTWKMGVNKFTDMTEEELKYWKGGNKKSLIKKNLSTKIPEKDLKSLPASVDWRDSDVITAVKDQVPLLCIILSAFFFSLTPFFPGTLRELLGSCSCGNN
jgi:hypothetical protein